MSAIPHKRALGFGLGGAIALAAVAWAVGGSIRSPAQIAADTAPPKPSLITVPVERRLLSTQVIVRGTMRYGSPETVELPASSLKTNSAIVTKPPSSGGKLREDQVAMVVSGRPVFVLQGAQPMNRDLGMGDTGPDVTQLEQALTRLGFDPGMADGRYDSATATAVSAWYSKEGWTPFGPTDVQSDQLRTSEGNAAAARQALLQAEVALETARRTGNATPTDVSQARIDAVTATDNVDTAALTLATARAKAKNAADAATRAKAALAGAGVGGSKDTAAAEADLAAKQSALSAATDAQADAQRAVDHPPPDNRPQELAALQTALRQATDNVSVARTAVDAAQSALAAANAAEAEAVANGTPDAIAKARADVAAAQADLVSKQAALNAALDAQADAQRAVDNPPPDNRPQELAALQITLRQANQAVGVAQRDLGAATTALAAAKASASGGTAQARADAKAAAREAQTADAELLRARQGLGTARRQALLARAKVAILSGHPDTALERSIVEAAAAESRRTSADVARLASRAGVQVPADEILFFPTLPLRVDSVKVKRGDAAAGRVMTVSNSQLAADSSLSIDDAKLVKVGAPVTIEQEDLGLKLDGSVTRVADKPGTNRVDPTRVYFEATPKDAPLRLAGASVKLTIAVQSTKGEVLAVPLSALSVGADGSSRVQVDRGGGRTAYVRVTPGLASNGLVEVKALQAGSLKPGDLVIVGAGGSAPVSSSSGSLSPPPAAGGSGSGVTSPGTSTSTTPVPVTGTTPAPSGTSTGPGQSVGTTGKTP